MSWWKCTVRVGGVRCSVLVEVYGEGGKGQMQCPGGGVW